MEVKSTRTKKFHQVQKLVNNKSYISAYFDITILYSGTQHGTELQALDNKDDDTVKCCLNNKMIYDGIIGFVRVYAYV